MGEVLHLVTLTPLLHTGSMCADLLHLIKARRAKKRSVKL